MKERLKMIFDRIDIFVVCIILGSCLTVADSFLGNWDVFAGCGIMEGVCAMLCDDLSNYRSLLHHPMQREAEEGADGYK